MRAVLILLFVLAAYVAVENAEDVGFWLPVVLIGLALIAHELAKSAGQEMDGY